MLGGSQDSKSKKGSNKEGCRDRMDKESFIKRLVLK